ncbi:MAG: hypothetical protein ABI220_02500 [Candidatus Saccharimonadales bacterium]
MLKTIIQFIISGSVVVAASYVAPKFGQKWAGLIVAAPLLTLMTFIFLSLNPASGSLHDYLASALLFMIPAAIFIACLLLLANHLNFVLNILISFGVFAVIVLAMHKLKLA